MSEDNKEKVEEEVNHEDIELEPKKKQRKGKISKMLF